MLLCASCVGLSAEAAAGSLMDEQRCAGGGDVYTAAASELSFHHPRRALRNTTPSFRPQQLKFHARCRTVSHTNRPRVFKLGRIITTGKAFSLVSPHTLSRFLWNISFFHAGRLTSRSAPVFVIAPVVRVSTGKHH